jgi:flavodoxin
MLTKKIILFLFCLLIPGLVWSGTIAQKETKVLVVYYSRTGHTQLVAEKLAKKFNADLERLIDKKKRIGPIAFLAAGKDAVSANTTVIDPLKHSPKDYDIILIGGPAWNGHVTPAVRTFITQNDLSDKKIGLFSSCHYIGVEDALKETANLISKGKNQEFPRLALREHEIKEEALTKKIDSFYQAIQEAQ